MGVALSSYTIPETGKPTFFIGENEMELGMGIQGEPGISKGAVKDADEACEAILHRIITGLPFFEEDEAAVLIGGLGATPKEELFIMYRKKHSKFLSGKIYLLTNNILVKMLLLWRSQVCPFH